MQSDFDDSTVLYLDVTITTGEVASHNEITTQILASATVTASSTDPEPEQHQRQQQQQPVRRPPMVVKSAEVQQPFEETRIHANLSDYSSK